MTRAEEIRDFWTRPDPRSTPTPGILDPGVCTLDEDTSWQDELRANLAHASNEELITIARNQGEHVYTYEFQTNRVSMWWLPIDCAVLIHEEWGGAATEPWSQEWAEYLGPEAAREELARHDRDSA